MHSAPTRFSLKIMKCANAKALIGDGIIISQEKERAVNHMIHRPFFCNPLFDLLRFSFYVELVSDRE